MAGMVGAFFCLPSTHQARYHAPGFRSGTTRIVPSDAVLPERRSPGRGDLKPTWQSILTRILSDWATQDSLSGTKATHEYTLGHNAH